MARILEVEENEDRRGASSNIVRQWKFRFSGVWIVALMLFLATVWIAVYDRDLLSEIWPESKTRDEVAVEQEEIVAPRLRPSEVVEFFHGAETEIIDGQIRLTISGEIRNTGTFEVQIPTLRGTLRNAGKEEIHSWTFTVTPSTLAPGEERSFSTIVEDIPPETAEFELFLEWPDEAS